MTKHDFLLSPQILGLINEQVQNHIREVTNGFETDIRALRQENYKLKKQIEDLTRLPKPLKLNKEHSSVVNSQEKSPEKSLVLIILKDVKNLKVQSTILMSVKSKENTLQLSNMPNLAAQSFNDNLKNRQPIAVPNLRSKSLCIEPTQYSDDDIVSSPIKISPKKVVQSSVARSQGDSMVIENDSGSVPYFKLLTQYSDTSSSPTRTQQQFQMAQVDEKENLLPELIDDDVFVGKSNIDSSPDKGSVSDVFQKQNEEYLGKIELKTDEEDVVEVEDSQEEEPQLGEVVQLYDSFRIEFPTRIRPYTKLQRIEFLSSFYKRMFDQVSDFKIGLKSNPINEIDWFLGDFKPNPNCQGKGEAKVTYVQTINGTYKRRVGITKQEEFNRKRFYRMAQGNGSEDAENKENKEHRDGYKTPGEDEGDDRGENANKDEDDEEYYDKLSQLFDKIPLPPGFMNSEFPDTQELKRRRAVIEKRQKRRIQRRLKECFSVRDGVQVGEFVFSIDIINRYVAAERYYL